MREGFLQASALSNVQPVGSESANLWCLRGRERGLCRSTQHCQTTLQPFHVIISWGQINICKFLVPQENPLRIFACTERMGEWISFFMINIIRDFFFLNAILQCSVFSSRKWVLSVYSRPLQQPRLLKHCIFIAGAVIRSMMKLQGD